MVAELEAWQEVTSHFSAVLPIWVEEGRLWTRLVLYANPRNEGRLEWRVPGGCNEEDETVKQTAVRELEQEAGLVAHQPSLFEIHRNVLDDKEAGMWGAKHLKAAFLTFEFEEAEGPRFQEPDVEGTHDFPLERVVDHIAGSKEPLRISEDMKHSGAYRIIVPFHEETIKQAVLQLSAEIPGARRLAEKAKWF